MRSRRTFAALAFGLLLACGCKDRGAKAPATPPVAPVEVVTDPAQIEAAKKAWADSREQKLAELLADPSTFQAYDDESVELVRSQRERSVASLTRTRDDASRTAAQRIHAALALQSLGVPPDPAQLAGVADADESTLRLLWDLPHLYKRPAALPAPLRRVVVRAVGSPDARVSGRAAQMAEHYRITEAADAVADRVRTDPGADANVLRAAASLRPTADVLDAVVARLRGSDPFADYLLVSALCEVAGRVDDPALRRRAAEAAADYLRRKPDGPSIDGGTTAGLETIGRAVPPEVAGPMLADVVRHAPHRYVRQYALAELNKLDAAAAAKLAAETKVKLPETDADDAREDGPAPEQAAAVCLRHKVLTPAEAEAALATLAARAKARADEARAADAENVEGEDSGDDSGGGVEGLLYFAKRFAAFDVETDVVPNRHDELVLDLSEASAGKFKPEAVLETYTEGGPDAGTYVLQFVHGGRLYRTAPRDLGDWYDVEAVLLAVNRAAADAGLAERFVPLAANGQVASVVFADPAALGRAAPELGLALGTDPDEARRLGKEYEGHVVEQLKAK